MGQRFQAHYIMLERQENSKVLVRKQAYHLQWCFGEYTIVRLEQVLNYMDKYLDNEYAPFHGIIYPPLEEGLKILQCLTSINMITGSYVNAIEEEEDVSLNPLNGDNNDGIFIIDLRENKPRYALFNYKFELVTPTEYMSDYKEMSEDENLILDLIEKISKYETISEEELRELYPEMYKELDGKEFVDVI